MLFGYSFVREGGEGGDGGGGWPTPPLSPIGGGAVAAAAGDAGGARDGATGGEGGGCRPVGRRPATARRRDKGGCPSAASVVAVPHPFEGW